MALDQKTLEAVFSSGVEIMGHAYTPSGFDRVSLDIDMLKAYIDNHEQFSADYQNVPLTQYRKWMESHGTPQCGATTKSGKRCKKPSGSSQSSIKRWVENDGKLCARHERDLYLSSLPNKNTNL